MIHLLNELKNIYLFTNVLGMQLFKHIFLFSKYHQCSFICCIFIFFKQFLYILIFHREIPLYSFSIIIQKYIIIVTYNIEINNTYFFDTTTQHHYYNIKLL